MGFFFYPRAMESGVAFWTISIAIAVGAMSPGPSFIFVARTAMQAGRRSGLKTALGMGLAGLLFATMAALGLAALLVAAGPVFIALSFLGAAYLAYVGVSMLIHAKSPLKVGRDANSQGQGVWSGFRTQVSNPKTVVVYASVFASVMPHSPEPWLLVALPFTIGIIEGVWYVVVATLFSLKQASTAYAKAKPVIDRIAGALMIALALKLALG